MKSLLITAGLAVGCLGSAYAQQAPLRGTILDAQTQQPLPGVTIVVPGTSTGTTTDASGRFALAVPSGTREVTVSLMGYNAQKVKVSGADNALTVRLEAAPVNLQGVVVSASREQEKRTEAPVAISQIAPQLIADTKATAPYQLLNKVAGVYMVNLGNEQHMMAIRQPISTNAVYLYLEDGLPIRPIGIFNHNALYEINQAGVRSIEVVKGPASSLYGSNAIGGAINFLTQRPTPVPTAGVSVQGDGFGYRRVDASASSGYTQAATRRANAIAGKTIRTLTSSRGRCGPTTPSARARGSSAWAPTITSTPKRPAPSTAPTSTAAATRATTASPTAW
jgi:iron complex outermembrane receptor protein